MKKGLLALTALVAFVFALPLMADAKIELTGAALVSAQDVDFDYSGDTLDEDFNFNDPRVNLYVNGEVSDKISVTAKFWASNDWSHENQRGGLVGAPVAGNNFAVGPNNSSIAMLRAFVTVKDVAGSGFDLKVGTIDIPFGWEYMSRTSNGDDMKNDFISNSLLDINGGDEGISLSGSFDMGQTSTPLAWEIALLNGGLVGDGNPAGTANNARSNDDLGWAIRAEVGVMENLTLQASWYTNDNKKDGDQDPLNIGSSFLVNNVNGAFTGAGVAGVGAGTTNGNLAGLVFGATGTGYDRDIWEISGKYDYGQGYVTAFWGNIDADTGSAATVGGGNREWDYWGAQARYNFDDNSYVAARYNRLEPDYTVGGVTNNQGEPDLWTIAAGYKLADNAMVKAEWTSFNEDGNGFSNVVSTASDARNADADALTVALGVSF